MQRRTHIWQGALILLGMFMALPALQAAPQIAGVAQVGNAASAGTRFVFVYLQYYEGAQPHPAHAVYHKPGMADAVSSYTRLAIIRGSTHIPTVAALMQRAAEAGFDNAALEADLDNLLPPGPYGTLAAKVAGFFQADLPGSFDALQKEAMLRVHPQMALVRGHAYLARVPDSGPNTFEVRVIHPATEEEGPVVARVTSPALPAILPPPEGLSEKLETLPRGHLRTHLRWCIPPTLAEKTFHWSGFKVFRVPRQPWNDIMGDDPPLNMSRQMLLDAIALDPALAVPVNRLPVLPHGDLPCPPQPASDVFFMTDDNDSAARLAFAPGGTSFPDGFEATYFVAACDHFGRIGELSPGLEVMICDRLPPSSPSRVRVDNIYKQEGADDHALRISWQREGVDEVKRYHLYRYANPDDVLVDRQSPLWPTTPNRIAVIDNPGAGERVAFADTTPGALTLPQDDGITRWFAVVAEDNTACPDMNGLGNLSGASGPVPGVLHDLANEEIPQGELAMRCCHILVNQVPTGTSNPKPLVAIRKHPQLAYVEFREQLSGTFLGRFHFEDTNQLALDPAWADPALFQARFGTANDFTSPWVGTFTSTFPHAEYHWTGRYECRIDADCTGGVIDPVDFDTGMFVPGCVTLVNVPNDAVQAALFRQLGDTGPLMQQGRVFLDSDFNGVNDVTQLCEKAPPANPGRACYYIQLYDRNGNPSVMHRVGCVDTVGTEGYPQPRITHFVPENLDVPLGAEAPVVVAWFCPRPGVDRFELALSPPPPAATVTFMEGGEAGVGATWGVVESDRVPNGFLDGSPNFALTLDLERGKPYRAKVRAVGEGPYDERNKGEWSDTETLAWLLDPGEGGGLPDDCPVPWPARDVVPLNTDTNRDVFTLLVSWEDFIDGLGPRPTREIWIHVGDIDRSLMLRNSQPDQTTVSIPALIETNDVTGLLNLPLPFTVYLHQVTPGSRGTMLQVSHYVDEILTRTPQPGRIELIDRAFAASDFLNGLIPPRLYFRVRQPLIMGRAYRAAIVLHGPDREPVEVLRTRVFNIPATP